jgi:hypothetical protein
VLPIGPHTMMHLFVPETPLPSLAAHGGDGDSLLRSVHRACGKLTRGNEVVAAWAPQAVRQHLDCLKVSADIPMVDYLRALLRADVVNVSTRLRAFDKLCLHVRAAAAERRPRRKWPRIWNAGRRK